MKTGHTEGEWSVVAKSSVLLQVEARDRVICHVIVTREEDRANAALIAAAPLLLAELISTHDELHLVEGLMPDGAGKDRFHDRLLSLRAAIDKATQP